MKINLYNPYLLLFVALIALAAIFTLYNMFRLSRMYITVDDKYNFVAKRQVLSDEHNHTIVYSSLGTEQVEKKLTEFLWDDLNMRNEFLLEYFPDNTFSLDYISYAYDYLILNMDHIKREIGYSNYSKMEVTRHSTFRIGNFHFRAPGISKEHYLSWSFRLHTNDNLMVSNERHFYKTEMHEYTEALLLVFSNAILAAQSKNRYYHERDYMLRWVFDGLAELVAYQFFFSRENVSEELKEQMREELVCCEITKAVDILNWSYPIHHRESIPHHIDTAVRSLKSLSFDENSVLYYRRSYAFFLDIYETYGINLIRELIQYIFDNRQFLKSEDVLHFLESKIGKEKLEKHLGPNYIERVEHNRKRMFGNIYNYFQTNNDESGIKRFFIDNENNFMYVPDIDLKL